jgi:hypothetical protein
MKSGLFDQFGEPLEPSVYIDFDEGLREPATYDYGTVAVFSDLHGNLWDLIQPN